ncbi:MAG: hypothetical protein Q4C22_06245, partial [Bacillota bacterium]|nr:hypothetical protein [Bacillota bacterium]
MGGRIENKLIFWDIDGTLLHCGDDGRRALNRAFFQLYGVEDAFAAANIGGAMDHAILTGILAAIGAGPEELPKVEAAYGEALWTVLGEDRKKRVLPGVEALLSAIHQAPGTHNALLTSNLRLGSALKLSSLGLEKWFLPESLLN